MNRHLNRLEKKRGNKVEIWVSPNFEAKFKEIFFSLEADMIAATRIVNPDGSIHYSFDLLPEKYDTLRKALQPNPIIDQPKNNSNAN